MNHKTKQAALKAARAALGDEAIEGVDFNITNTGAGWTHAEIPAANEAAAAAQGSRLGKLETLDEFVDENFTAQEAAALRVGAAESVERLKLQGTDEQVSCSDPANPGKPLKMTPAEASAAGYVEAKDIAGHELWAKPDSPLLVDGTVYPNKTRATEAKRLRDLPRQEKPAAAPKAPKAAKAAAKAKKAPTPKPAAPKGRGKGDILKEMLSSPGGATSAEMEKAVGWLPHSVRGYLGTLRTKGVNVVAKKLPKEPTIYRIVPAAAAPAPASEAVGDVV